MRRGLMGWDAEELPKAALEARIARLRAAMGRDSFDAVLLYTNNVRPSAVTWLTGFTPYWSDGMLLLTGEGAPMFATALSKRVANWIRTTDTLSEIVNTPKPGAAVGKRIVEAGCKRVGVLEYDALPAGLYDEIVGAVPAIELVDMGSAFADARKTIDCAERRLIGRADALAASALDQIDASSARDAGEVAGLVEKHARLGGAEEAYIAVAPDLAADRRMIRVAGTMPVAERFAVRASVAYKGCWVRRTRSVARHEAGAAAFGRADEWLKNLASGIVAGTPLANQIADASKNLAGTTVRNWAAEACVGSYPLETISYVPADKNFLVLTVELIIDGIPWLGATPVFVGR